MTVPLLMAILGAGPGCDPLVSVVARAEPLAAVLRRLGDTAQTRIRCDDGLAKVRLITAVDDVPLSQALERIAWAVRARVVPGRDGVLLRAVPPKYWEGEAWERAVEEFHASVKLAQRRDQRGIQQSVGETVPLLGELDSEDVWDKGAGQASEWLVQEVLASVGTKALVSLPVGRHVFSTAPTVAQRLLPTAVFDAYRRFRQRAGWFNDAFVANGVDRESVTGRLLVADEEEWVDPERIDMAVYAGGSWLSAEVMVVGRRADGRRAEHRTHSAHVSLESGKELSAPDLPAAALDGAFEPTAHEAWFWETFHRYRERRLFRRAAPPRG